MLNVHLYNDTTIFVFFRIEIKHIVKNTLLQCIIIFPFYYLKQNMAWKNINFTDAKFCEY